MKNLRDIYGLSLATLTDLYEITMAYGYWKLGRFDEEAVFHLYFRRNPFGGGYAAACGLAYVVDLLTDFRFDPDDLDYLSLQAGRSERPLFDAEFIDFLRNLELTVDIDAVPEGTVVFAFEPILRVRGPLLQCQLLETALLNIINFQTLIATKAARICQAAAGEPVLEFGLRRAHGIDGALAASRASYIGGCTGTSNVLAGRLFDIPVKGTHAHSWVMSFDSEAEAFQAYAAAMPDNAIFLVDTYDTLQGVRHAIEAGRALREQGYEMSGIRLDSGDLTWLSNQARRMLDEAGFADTFIVGSGDLDEQIIQDLRDQGAKITVWGVGTRLATAHGEGALGGVYKLSAIRSDGGRWQYKIKLSEQGVKINIPGILQVRRFEDERGFTADMIYDELLGAPTEPTIVDLADPTRRKKLESELRSKDLLVPVLQKGRCVYRPEPLAHIRERLRGQLERLHPGIRRFLNPHTYPAGIEKQLYETRNRLILQSRGFAANGPG